MTVKPGAANNNNNNNNNDKEKVEYNKIQNRMGEVKLSNKTTNYWDVTFYKGECS